MSAGFGMFLYNVTIQKPNGGIEISKWPIDFTTGFSDYISLVGGEPVIEDSGIKQLQDNRLWIQIIDENGSEIQSFDKPVEVSLHYSPSDILHIYQKGIGDYSVFFCKLQAEDEEWTYLIGFPMEITKVILYVNGERFATIKPVIFIIFGVTLVLLIASSYIYGFLMSRQMQKMRKSIREVIARAYEPKSDTGSFGDLYEELNTLNSEIRFCDEAREKEEKLREEWIANITHDLKTPLSPIKGYAELIAAESETSPEEFRKYGEIIRKNMAYAEELINDLKLTYQLKNGMLPINRSRKNVVRFLKEIVIDLLNNTEYGERSISFCSTEDKIELRFDEILFKRAFMNLITNALVHNNQETKVTMSVKTGDSIEISIQDNGHGISKEELDHLFVRYYRGDNMAAKPEGTGLGMAIARQIFELHGGNIAAQSEPGYGTCITIMFPMEN